MKKALLLTAMASALLASSCAVADSVKDGAISFAKEGVGIRAEAGAREIILDLNPDTTSLPLIMSIVEPIVDDAATDGAVIAIWIVTGGVAAAMSPVNLETARGGDLRFEGKNLAAWEREAEDNMTAVLTATELALKEYVRDGTGADLFGALLASAARVVELPGSDRPEIYLITGGGVHRTGVLDLQTVDFMTADPAEIAAMVTPVNAPTVSVQVVGAGNFPHVVPPPDAVWATGVRATWEAFCDSANTKTCTVHDVAMTEEG